MLMVSSSLDARAFRQRADNQIAIGVWMQQMRFCVNLCGISDASVWRVWRAKLPGGLVVIESPLRHAPGGQLMVGYARARVKATTTQSFGPSRRPLTGQSRRVRVDSIQTLLADCFSKVVSPVNVQFCHTGGPQLCPLENERVCARSAVTFFCAKVGQGRAEQNIFTQWNAPPAPPKAINVYAFIITSAPSISARKRSLSYILIQSP